MTIEYDAIKDKNASSMIDALKKMCTLVQSKHETSTEGRSKEMVKEKYLCPCGIVNVISSTMKHPEVLTIYVGSDRCGI